MTRNPRFGRLPLWALASVALLGLLAGCKNSNDIAAPAYSVSGVVRHAVGPGFLPVPGASVWVSSDGYVSTRVASGADGAYTISGVPAGTLTVHAYKGNGPSGLFASKTVTVPPSPASLDLILAPDND